MYVPLPPIILYHGVFIYDNLGPEVEKTGPGETSRQIKGWRDLGQSVGPFTIGVVVSLRVSHGHFPPPSVAQHVAA